MRDDGSLSKTSVSAVKWSFVKRFDSTQDCINHFKKNHFVSVVTSPHLKGNKNVILHEGDFTIYHKFWRLYDLTLFQVYLIVSLQQEF